MISLIKKTFALLVVLPAVCFAAGGVPLEAARFDPSDKASLQRGARTFVNYCLNCHGAAYMRYSRLTDLGLTEAQIRDNLIPTSAKFGETMNIAMSRADAKAWLNAAPPDLTVVARARGADWLYSYLKSYYRDPASSTGWNNTVFNNVSMPHALWELQGSQVLKVEEKDDGHGGKTHVSRLELESPGKLSPKEYDLLVLDLVNYLDYMGEPAKQKRKQIGILVLFGLALLFVFVAFLKKEYWKDVT